uniref:Uncharacterized protein n=1 Tax=Cyprinus carpio TaxID=7962 RepID=A0A8C1SS81_CYPCA
MEEGSSVSEHAIKMSGYTQRLEQLECTIPEELKIDRVLQSLPPSYKSFVVTHNQIGSTDTITELFAKLKAAEVDIKKAPPLRKVRGKEALQEGGGKRCPC